MATTCAETHGRSCAREVEIVGRVVGHFGSLFQGVDFLGGEGFEFVDCHADGFFLVGGNVAEVGHKLVYGPFLTQIFKAESLNGFGIRCLQLRNLGF